MQAPIDAISREQRERLAFGAQLDILPRAYDEPPAHGVIRSFAGDFQVSEILPFSCSGVGEHLYLKVRKTAQNTRWVARELAKRFHLPYRSVSFAGLKDRHAVAEQWFSLHLPRKSNTDLKHLDIGGVEIVDHSRHAVKLRRGMLAGNRFRIIVRDLSGDLAELERRLNRLIYAPIPNYFGTQRFGKRAGNLTLLEADGNAHASDRAARSFGLSAIRSALFNGYLGQRIRQKTWLTPLPGEILYDPAADAYKHLDKIEPGGGRYESTGLLWGCGENKATDLALSTETEYFDQFREVTHLLSKYQVRMMRRPLSIRLPDLRWVLSENSLELAFTLQRGMYATVVLREIVKVTEPPAR